MNQNIRYVIGIDPDVEKSGYAVWDRGEKKFILWGAYPFWNMIHEGLESIDSDDVMIVIEGGWLNEKANFHGHPNQSKSAGERIAKNVGANHQVGKLLVAWCEFHKVPHKVVKPLLKNPILDNELKKLGIKNADTRSAAKLVYGY